MRRPQPLALVLLAALAVSGCANDDSSAEPEVVAIGGATASAQSAQRPWGTVTPPPQMEKAEPPNAADATFIRMMIPHHEQALRLADGVLSHPDIDERVRAAAEFIAADQSREIELMQSWLDAWGDELPPEDHAHHDHHAMPGMVDEARVDALAELDDEEAVAEFVVLMLEHHDGAIVMSRDHLTAAGNAYTLATAQHIIREQQLEVAYLQNLRDELCTDATFPACQ